MLINIWNVYQIYQFQIYVYWRKVILFRLTNTELPVNVSKTISCSLGGKKKVINIQVSAEITTPTFKKGSNNSILYMLPSNYAIVENVNGNSYIKCWIYQWKVCYKYYHQKPNVGKMWFLRWYKYFTWLLVEVYLLLSTKIQIFTYFLLRSYKKNCFILIPPTHFLYEYVEVIHETVLPGVGNVFKNLINNHLNEWFTSRLYLVPFLL